MIRVSIVPALALLAAACGQSDEDALQDAAEQSDPAAATVLENAAENGMDPQEALAAAGEAAAANTGAPEQRSLQAKPNLPGDPNRPEAGEPPAKVETPVEVPAGNAATNHEGH